MAGAYNHNVLKEAKRLCDESQEYKIFGNRRNLADSILLHLVIMLRSHSDFQLIIHQFTEPEFITEDIVERYKEEGNGRGVYCGIHEWNEE